MSGRSNIIIHKDFWVLDGVPVYTVRLQEAATCLGITKNALERRLEKKPELAHKGQDGLLRIRIRDLNAIQGIGEALEWDRPTPPPQKPERVPAPSAPANVVRFRGGGTA